MFLHDTAKASTYDVIFFLEFYDLSIYSSSQFASYAVSVQCFPYWKLKSLNETWNFF